MPDHIEIEVFPDSRKLDATRTSAKQTFNFAFILDPDFLDHADTDYEFKNASDDIIALEFAYSVLPLTRIVPDNLGNKIVLILSDIGLEQGSGRREWRCSATYSFDTNTGTGGERAGGGSPDTLPYIRYSFTIGGGTKSITRSISSTKALADDAVLAAPAALKNVIGATEDGIEGTEVPDSGLRLQITGYYLPATITLAFVNVLKGLVAGGRNTGSYNDDTYLGRPSGEVQLRQISGGGTVVDIIPLTFDFVLKNNISDEPDEGFPNLTMLGHDYLEYRYYRGLDLGAEKILMKPEERIIHRIHTPEDYSLTKLPI